MLSWLRSLVLRLAGSQELRPTDGVIAMALILFPIAAGYGAIMYYGLTHPEAAPYANQEWLEMNFAVQTRIVLPGWLAFLVTGLLARKRWPDSRLLAHAAAQFFVMYVVYASYGLGFYTDLFGAMNLFAATALGFLLLGFRVIRAGIISFVALVVATTVAEQVGIIPYAPWFSASPIEAGHLATSWLLSAGGLSFLILVAIAALFLAAMHLARTREQRLQRATGLIRRYVPAQLAARILAGEHTGGTTPERRKLTLFFSDVVEFTAASDRMEAEDLSALLNEYLSEMAAIADSAGATVNQFVGDGIMIFFGAPEATDSRSWDQSLRSPGRSIRFDQKQMHRCHVDSEAACLPCGR